MKALLIVALLFVAAPVYAQDKLFTVSEWAVLTAHGLDAASSQRAFGEGRGVEANHFLAQFENPLAFTAAKFVIGGGQLWMMRKLKAAGHPKWAIVANFGTSAVFTSIAIRNGRIGRR